MLKFLAFERKFFAKDGLTVDQFLQSKGASRPSTPFNISDSLTSATPKTKLDKVINLFSHNSLVTCEVRETQCNTRANIALMSTGFLGECLNLRTVLDPYMPRLESMQEGDDVTIPLLYFNHLYFLISSIHMCGCDNPNCPECRRTQNKNFDQRDIINLFRNTTFEDAFNIATNSNTMETYNKLRAELTNHSIDMLRPRAPPVSNAQILNTTLAEAAELSERKGRMREAGIQPPPSRMRDRHHHRTRYITLKEAHQIFGHTTSEEVIKATLTSGAVLGLALKPGSVSVDRFTTGL